MTTTGTSEPTTTSAYVKPTVTRIGSLVAELNAAIRGEHAAGKVVLVAEDHLTKTGEHPLPQIRLDIRKPEDAISRPEDVD